MDEMNCDIKTDGAFAITAIFVMANGSDKHMTWTAPKTMKKQKPIDHEEIEMDEEKYHILYASLFDTLKREGKSFHKRQEDCWSHLIFMQDVERIELSVRPADSGTA